MAASASRIARYFVPVGVGASLMFQGSILADGIGSRPNPAAVYAEPSVKDADLCASSKEPSQSQSSLPSGSALKVGCAQTQPRVCQDTELERFVMTARQSMGPYKDTLMCYVNEGVKHASHYYDKLMDNVCYLRTGAPQEVKVGTIVAGGLTGMLLGIRGGMFRKLLMGTVGASGGAYLAYPNETEKYTKKYTTIAYNFIAGPRK